MRRAFVIIPLAILALVSGCSRAKREAAIANNTVAPAGFVPPTALNRTDFVDLLDKRFTQLDLNHDSILEASEVPSRHHDRIIALDANHDGKITLDEFEKGGLSRFDEADLNQDQVLTGEERRDALGNEVDESDSSNSTSANGSAANTR